MLKELNDLKELLRRDKNETSQALIIIDDYPELKEAHDTTCVEIDKMVEERNAFEKQHEKRSDDIRDTFWGKARSVLKGAGKITEDQVFDKPWSYLEIKNNTIVLTTNPKRHPDYKKSEEDACSSLQ